MLSRLSFFLHTRFWLLLLAAANLGGFLFGLWYYWPQLLTVTPAAWLFVIDSPLYVLFFSLVCAQLFRNRTVHPLFLLITAIGLIKVGFWTVFVLHLNWAAFFGRDLLLYSAIYPMHWGMVLEGLVVLPFLKTIRIRHIFLSLSWFLFNDFLDYGMGLYPWFPANGLGLVALESVAATVVLAAFFTVKLFKYR